MYFYHTIFAYNFTPVLEYGLVTPDEEKHRRGFVFHQNILLLKKLKNTSLLNHLNLYIISYKHNIQSYTDIKTKIIRWQNLFLSLEDTSNGRPFLPTNSWRALKHRLLSTPELSLVSQAGTRCSNNQVPVFRLNTNPELISKFSQLSSYNRPSYCRFSLKTLSLLFSLFPINSLKSIPPE